MAFVYAWIVPLWTNRFLPQLLMEQFDTLPIQCRHIEHMHEGVYNSTEIFFSKLRSAGLNYNLPSFSLTLTVRGISNKYCLLTFFIIYVSCLSCCLIEALWSPAGKGLTSLIVCVRCFSCVIVTFPYGVLGQVW